MNFSRIKLILLLFGFTLKGSAFLHAATISVDKTISISNPVSISIQINSTISESLQKYFNVSKEYTWKKIASETGIIGITHSRYQQFVNEIKVENAIVIIHSRPGENTTVNGEFVKFSNTSNEKPLPFSAIESKINHELKIRRIVQSEEILWVKNMQSNNFTLQYRIEFSEENNVELKTIYLNAFTGDEISSCVQSCHADVQGVAFTGFHGTQNILTSVQQGNYILKSTSKGSGIETRNLNNQLNYNSVSDFTDSDNIWQQSTDANKNHATDAHFCAEKYYDFLNQKFNRNSVDNNGQKLISYLNYGNGLRNAFWNGTAVVYGSGNTTGGPLTTLDIAGHEFTHAMIQKTANLNYAGESGTINEAVADIFGTALEHFAMQQTADWQIGEKSGPALRSMAIPELYNQPSTYQGVNWYSGSGDNGGVHINSGFINKWFYLVTVGGQGINDNGINYSVQGISIQKSVQIVYSALVFYSLPNTGYRDFMNYTIKSAADLYGVCSTEYLQVLNAWKAVGLYDYGVDVVNISSATGNSFCSGDSIAISADGIPGSIFSWYKNAVLLSSGTSNSIYTSEEGNYFVTESRCGNLFMSSTIQIIKKSLPVVSVTSTTGCENEIITLTGFPSNGIFSVPNPYSGNSTSFNYTYTNATGCSATATGTITIYQKPEVNILNSEMQFPENSEPILLYGNASGTFSGTGVVGNYFHPEIAKVGGPYAVYFTVTNTAGCSSVDSIHLLVEKPCVKNPESILLNQKVVEKNGNQLIAININANQSDFNFEWNIPNSLQFVENINDTLIYISIPEKACEIQVNLTNTCGEIYNKKIQITPVKPKSEFSFSIYPNPANEIILIKITDYEKENKISIIDSRGRIIKSLATFTSDVLLNISGLSKGVYEIQIINNKQSISQKLVIN